MINVIIICITILLISIFGFIILNKYIDRILSIKEQKNKHDLYQLYNSIDVEKYNNIIDEKIKSIFETWILVNISVNNVQYIRSEDIDECINYTTKKFVLEISDTYLFYIQCLTIINNDNDLLVYIREKVKMQVLEFVTKFNSDNE